MDTSPTGFPVLYHGELPQALRSAILTSIKRKDMATPLFSPVNDIEAWDDVITQLEAFVNDTNADIDMAYDWVCEQLDISSFVDNEVAWDSFYNAWEACDNRNDLITFQIA